MDVRESYFLCEQKRIIVCVFISFDDMPSLGLRRLMNPVGFLQCRLQMEMTGFVCRIILVLAFP